MPSSAPGNGPANSLRFDAVALRAAPELRGGLAARLVGLLAGLFLFAAGIVALLESRLGLSPWDVLHQGIARHSPLSFGEANIAVGVVVVAAAAALGARIGVGTVANAALVGTFVDLQLRLDWVRDLADAALPARIGLLGLGISVIAVGTALYIGAAMGAGPRDSLMLALSRWTGVRVGAVRAAIELAALIGGFALGGKVGVGTLAFALLVGPAVEGSFFALERSPFGRPASPIPAASMAS